MVPSSPSAPGAATETPLQPAALLPIVLPRGEAGPADPGAHEGWALQGSPAWGSRSHGRGQGWVGVHISRIPELGVAGLNSMQSFPPIIRAFLWVSYWCFATGSGLSAMQRIKKRPFRCQNAYCLKCRFFFIIIIFSPKSKPIYRKPD